MPKIVYAVLKGPSDKTHMTLEAGPNPAAYLSYASSLREVIKNLAELNIPYAFFADLLSEGFCEGHILSFTALCFKIPFSQSKDTPESLMKTYMDRADGLAQDFHRAHLASGHLAIRSPLFPKDGANV